MGTGDSAYREFLCRTNMPVKSTGYAVGIGGIETPEDVGNTTKADALQGVSRAVQEVMVTYVSPFAGQTRGLFATNSSRQRLDDAANKLHELFGFDGVLAAGEYDIRVEEVMPGSWRLEVVLDREALKKHDLKVLQAKTDRLYALSRGQSPLHEPRAEL